MVFTTIHDYDDSLVPPLDYPPHQYNASLAPNDLEHACALHIRSKTPNIRLSGIICTIGPASRDPDILEQLMAKGMNIARLNFSHGTHEYHAETIENVRLAVCNYSQRTGMPYPLAIALDTKGPEIRTGLLEGGGSAEVELKKGDAVKLTTDKSYAQKSSATIIYVDYENITQIVKPGNKIFVDDGLISLLCGAIQGSFLNCTVENGGMLGSKKGINLPGLPVDLPAISDKDKEDLRFGVEQGVDMIFASFIRTGSALREIRDVLGPEGARIQVISKIESQQGMDNLDEIIAASDGIMAARGDLGIEIPTEKVPVAQKEMIAKCNKAGKPAICATQMLESMTKKPRPTRAEASDVANAVLDGADCVMLSGETAKGDYPLECVHTMSNICKEAEALVYQKRRFENLLATVSPPVDAGTAVAIGAVQIAQSTVASAIIVVTQSGRSAQLISRFKPKCPILTVTRNAQTARQLHVFRGCLPLIYQEEKNPDWFTDLDSRINYAVNFGKAQGFLRCGDVIVIVSGFKQGAGCTNSVRVSYVLKENFYENK